ncbi:TetR/AcrR family transcriptional regulator [Clostridium sp. CF011]|uniref:TetR/AcrR family transcriptional regulator n=1 Tax=Clostridium sp. CF011 TaxID=2843318 RepID=UPI001C0DCD64|nr:TetR/AcrR family transcriptional regulator [Clostridium sp. CF011]MBU3093412.1 TetR/AcrR family transcriptional regulator [Clostridium sp. CF011]WAG71259.1 TetR/AcrR family transcriptional regulator [Clostridium sp. CF011]
MSKSTNKLAIQSEQWLLESFYRLLEKKSFKEISISEISKNAGLDRRTFYRHFKSTEELLEKYCQTIISEFTALLLKQGTISKSNVTIAYFSFWGNHLDFLNLLQRDNLLFFLLKEFDQLLIITRETVMPEIKESSITKEEHYALAFHIGGFFNLLAKWLSQGAVESPEEMAAIMRTLFPTQL